MSRSRQLPLGGASGQSSGSLPIEFLADIRRRVSVAAAVFGVMWLIVGIMASVSMRVAPFDGRVHTAWRVAGNEITSAMIMLSVALAYLAPRLPGRADRILAAGMAYQVINAAAIAFISQWNEAFPGRGISWICITVLIYPAIVPTRAIPTLLVGLLCASIEPLVYWIALKQGVVGQPLPTLMLFWNFFPTYLCAGLAVIPARVVRQLGQQVKAARQLGNYRLTERLGVGGMGEVYRATHRLLARPAAVKVIAPSQLGSYDQAGRSLLTERFHREANAAAALRSPHTIELYDFGVAGDGTLYYAMELLDGYTLQSLVDEFGPQSPSRTIHILRQACRSLAEAHQLGLVHRDVKPSNLMVCRMGTEVDFVKVLDFGLVKSHRGPKDAQLTAPELTAGTPAFMPPEAIDGVAALDQRADLYALGCVAYWLLTGRPVFQASSPLAVLLKHASEPPPPMIGSITPIPPGLEALVLRCLAKKPADRPADALQLERELARMAREAPWTEEDAASWWSKYGPGAKEAAA